MNEEYSIIWKNFIELLRNSVSQVTINSWFKDLKLYEIKDSIMESRPIKIVILETPSSFIKDSLIKRYLDTISDVMEKILGIHCEIEIKTSDEIRNDSNSSLPKLNETVDNINTNPQNIIHNPITQSEVYQNYDDNLIEKYTFDNFIIGESNRLAHTAALAVAEQPGKLYNPFFIHGKSGLGKTHLMHAIGNYIKKNLNKRVLYVTSEQFITDFTTINMKKDADYIQKFKDKYRNIDVLMIDDIQFLGGAEKTQQEFFHTFNNLYDMNKQIIISSDRSPDDLKLLEERLRT